MKNTKKAFTLIEIMIVIAILGIIALSISNLNFNSLSDRQRVDGFFYKIKTNIETIKNNALIGKEIKIDHNLKLVPKKWKIEFNNSGSGIIKTYFLDNSGNFKNYQNNNIIPKKHYSIEIKNNGTKLTNTGSLIIQGGNLSLTGAGIVGKKILEIKTKYKNFEKKFSINTISGVIEEK